jgi:hypothetical protein
MSRETIWHGQKLLETASVHCGNHINHAHILWTKWRVAGCNAPLGLKFGSFQLFPCLLSSVWVCYRSMSVVTTQSRHSHALHVADVSFHWTRHSWHDITPRAARCRLMFGRCLLRISACAPAIKNDALCVFEAKVGIEFRVGQADYLHSTSASSCISHPTIVRYVTWEDASKLIWNLYFYIFYLIFFMKK